VPTRFAVAFVVLLAVACGVAGCSRPAEPVARWDLLALVRDDPARPAGRTVRTHQEYGDTRHVVAVAVPDRLAWPLVVPAGAVLDVGVAVQATQLMAFAPHLAEPVRVRVVVAPAGDAERVVLERRLDVRGRTDDRRWLDLRVDLAPWAGRTVTLALEAALDTGAGSSPTTVLFSAPRVVDASADAPSLLLVTIDCLRADHLGAWGYARPTSPRLDALAAEGVRFAHAYTAAPMTMPSLPQLWSGRVFPAAGDETFLAPIARAGIPSAVIVNNVWLQLWLTLYRRAQPADQPDLLVAADGAGAQAITDRALAWLAARGGERFALVLHYLDAHSPYVLPAPAFDVFRDPAYAGRVDRHFDDAAGAAAGRYDAADRARVISLYDGAVRFVDQELGRLLDRLRADGRLDRTVVVVSADHGEELWDHGGFFHGQSLFDELLHVPLIVRLPGGVHAGTVVERPVRSIDVGPALLDWMGLPAPGTFAGRPLAQVMAAPDDPGDDLVATAANPQFPTRFALRTATHKLIEDTASGRRTLYDLVRDPGETTDVLAAAPDVAAALGGRLDRARAVLRHRGHQVRVVGAGPGTPFHLRLESTGGGKFVMLDRVDAGPDVTLDLAPDGRSLVVRGTTDAAGRGVRFDRRPQPLDPVADGFTVTLDVAGAPAPPAAVRIGEGAPLAPGGALDAEAPALTAAGEAPGCPAPDRGARACLWRWREAGPGAVVAGPPGPARERLRALGYVD
jgi:arylsulfatase A-like enzyme